MNSIALQDQTGHINLVLIEPKEGKRQSQIEEFLQFYGAPGVQHIALHTESIVETVQTLGERGLRFVPAPAIYYDLLPERVGEMIHTGKFPFLNGQRYSAVLRKIMNRCDR